MIKCGGRGANFIVYSGRKIFWLCLCHGVVINRAKFDAGTSNSFRGVKTDTQTDTQTDTRTDRIALYILDLAMNFATYT